MNREVYDIETLYSCFTYTGLDISNNKVVQFVLHKDRFELENLINHLLILNLQIGFNNISFDYPIIHYILKNHKNWIKELNKDIIDKETIILFIYQEAQRIINEQEQDGFNSSSYIKQQDWKIFQCDLFKMWHYNNKAKSTSLKALEVSMNLDNVIEMSIYHGKQDIILEEVDSILEYNLNDVLATYEFWKLSYGKIQLRKKLKQKYGLECISWNNGKIGEELILKLYCDKTGLNYWETKKLRTIRTEIKLVDCIPSNIVFKTKEFNEILDKFRNKTINIIDLKNKVKGVGEVGQLKFKDCFIDYGAGGIHGITERGLYQSNDKFIIKTLDVSSLYPWLAIILKLYPEHLGEIFTSIYKEDIVDVRMTEKAKKPEERDNIIIDGFKEAANLPYGKSGDENSFLYDYLYTMKTTVSGQLYLSMLAEQLGEIRNCKILMINTKTLVF